MKPFYLLFQQQIHAQQIPGAPPQPIPTLGALAGPLSAFGGPMGLPHGPQGLLKAPQDLHREELKVPLGGPSAEERLVRNKKIPIPSSTTFEKIIHKHHFSLP